MRQANQLVLFMIAVFSFAIGFRGLSPQLIGLIILGMVLYALYSSPEKSEKIQGWVEKANKFVESFRFRPSKK